MVVASIGPNFHTFTVALLLLAAQIGTGRKIFQLCYHVLPRVLAEHAKVCELIILPEAFVCLAAWFGCAEHTHADSLPVNPVALEVGAIGPNQLAIAAPCVLVVNDSLISGDAAGRRSTLLMVLSRHVHIVLRKDGDHAHLAHVLEGAKICGFKAEFAVLDA